MGVSRACEDQKVRSDNIRTIFQAEKEPNYVGSFGDAFEMISGAAA
jgi:hypothetical protein